MYNLSPCIRLVNGYKSAVIYDSVDKKIYEISKDVGKLIIQNKNVSSKEHFEKLCRREFKNHLFKKDDFKKLVLNIFENKLYVRTCDISSIPEFKFDILPSEKPSRSKIEITGKCNFSCKHCYASGGPNLHQISKVKIISLIEELHLLGVKFVQFTGGEPLLNIHLRDYLSKALSFSMQVKIATNGSLLNDATIKFLMDNNIEIQISLYGITEESYLKIGCSKEQFRTIFKNVEKIASINQDLLSLTHTLNSTSIDETDKLINYMKGLNVEMILGRPYKVGRAASNWAALKTLFANKGYSVPYFVEKTTDNIYEPSFRCTACKVNSIDILYDGSVSICVLIRKNDMTLGNIYDSKLSDIWDSKQRKYLSSIFVDEIPICCSCEYKYLCGGGCMAGAYSLVGMVDEPFPYCRSQESRIRKYYKNIFGIQDF